MSDNVISIENAVKGGKEVGTEWPTSKPLPSKLLPVEQFSEDLLPTALRPWLEDISERIDVPLDFVAIPAMTALSSVVGSKVGVRPEAKTNWTEAANLWGLIVGEPGSKKSPATAEVFAPLKVIEKAERRRFDIEMERFAAEAEVAKMARDLQQRDIKKALADGDHELAVELYQEAFQPSPPVHQRRIVQDVTVEKLGEICRDNPDGLLYHRDELLTLFDDLDRQEQAANRGFLMEGWGGQAGYTFDRITRGETKIDTVNIALFGTTQPNRISSFIASNIAGKNDGLAQRIQLLAWPDETEVWTPVDRSPNANAAQSAHTCFSRLHAMSHEDIEAASIGDGTGIPFLRLTPEAREMFVSYRERLERKIRDRSEEPALINHLSKYRGLGPRIALLCHLADFREGYVRPEAMQKALGWLTYLETHARRAYGSTTIDHSSVARSVLFRIERGDLQDGFTERDIYSKGWSNLTKGKRLSEGLGQLVEHGWLRSTRVKTGGRPSEKFSVNPNAFTASCRAA